MQQGLTKDWLRGDKKCKSEHEGVGACEDGGLDAG